MECLVKGGIEMRVFEDLSRTLEVGQEVEDLRIREDLCLSDLKGSPIFLVFWKTL